MAIPPNAKAMAQPMDPTDILDFSVLITKGQDTDVPVPMLRPDEGVATCLLSLTAEAMAAGLRIKNDENYPSPTLNDLTLIFWLDVDPALQASPMFSGAGVTVALELTVTTTANPPRRKQRTLTVTVAQQ